MARSRRKHSIAGNAVCRSEHAFKRRTSRRVRHYNEQQLRLGAVETPNDLLHTREMVNVYWGGKDGKRYFDPARFPEIRRK